MTGTEPAKLRSSSLPVFQTFSSVGVFYRTSEVPEPADTTSDLGIAPQNYRLSCPLPRLRKKET